MKPFEAVVSEEEGKLIEKALRHSVPRTSPVEAVFDFSPGIPLSENSELVRLIKLWILYGEPEWSPRLIAFIRREGTLTAQVVSPSDVVPYINEYIRELELKASELCRVVKFLTRNE